MVSYPILDGVLRQRHKKNRDTTLAQIAILPSQNFLVITKSRLPLYHIQKSVFQRNFGPIMSNIVSPESSKSTL